MSYSSNIFTYIPETRVMVGELSSMQLFGFPKSVEIESEKTGRTVTFVADTEAAINAEFWDGELYQYKPTEFCGVETLTLIND